MQVLSNMSKHQRKGHGQMASALSHSRCRDQSILRCVCEGNVET